MTKSLQMLVAFSDSTDGEYLSSALSQCGMEPIFSPTVNGARAILASRAIRAVFCQARLADGSFRDLLDGVHPKAPVVVCSRFYDKNLYIEAMCLGAFDYMVYPYRRTEVEWIVGNALRHVGGYAPKSRKYASDTHVGSIQPLTQAYREEIRQRRYLPHESAGKYNKDEGKTLLSGSARNDASAA